MLRKGHGGLYNAPIKEERRKRKAKKRERERDQSKFIDLRFERWQAAGFSELCLGKAMVAYRKPRQRKKEESKRLRGEWNQMISPLSVSLPPMDTWRKAWDETRRGRNWPPHPMIPWDGYRYNKLLPSFRVWALFLTFLFGTHNTGATSLHPWDIALGPLLEVDWCRFWLRF